MLAIQILCRPGVPRATPRTEPCGAPTIHLIEAATMQLLQRAGFDAAGRTDRGEQNVRIIASAVAAIVVLALIYAASGSAGNSAETVAAMSVFP
jgi:hypothetical protein